MSEPIERAKLIEKFAEKLHDGVFRAEGMAQIVHSRNVAATVTEWTDDVELRNVAIVHDVLDPKNVSTEPSREEVRLLLNQVEFAVLEDVLRIDDWLGRFRQDGEVPNVGQMFLDTSLDIRCLLITLAEMKDSESGVDSLPLEERELFGRALIELFAPICVRLGNWALRRRFEDTGFRLIHEPIYGILRAHLLMMKEAFAQEVGATLDEMREVLGTVYSGIEVGAQWQMPSSFYRRLRKLKLADRLSESFLRESFSSVSSLSHLMVIRAKVESIPQCYESLGKLHTNWRAAPDSFVDYISNPKPTGYSAIHTRIADVLGPESSFDVRITSKALHTISERGVCIPSVYRLWKNVAIVGNDLTQETAGLSAELQGQARALIDSLTKPSSPSAETTAFTPEGRPVSFSESASPLDFAYAVHSEIGYAFQYAEVNGVRVENTYQLRDGDMVRIITSPEVQPCESQLQLVRTRHAREQINAWLNKSSLRIGMRLLRGELQDAGYEHSDLETQAILADIARRDFGNLEQLYESVGEGTTTPSSILARLVDLSGYAVSSLPGIMLEERCDDVIVQLAKCCNPSPPDPITASGPHRGLIKVHNRDCRNVAGSDTVIGATWHKDALEAKTVEVELQVIDRRGLIRDLGDICYRNDINIESLDTHDIDANLKGLAVRLSGKPFAIRQALDRCRELQGVVGVTTKSRDALLASSASTQPIPWRTLRYRNPYNPGQPVVNRSMFFGRTKEVHWLNQRLGNSFWGSNLLLVGQRRVGKTSLLRHVETGGASESLYFPVYIDLQICARASDARALLLIAHKVRKILRAKGYEVDLKEDFGKDDPYTVLDSYIDIVHEHSGGRQLLLLLDEFDALVSAYQQNHLSLEFFTHLRALMQADRGPKFVLCGSLNMISDMEDLGLMALLNAVVRHEIGALDASAAELLVSKPLERSFTLDARVPPAVAEMTGGYPYFIQHICYRLFEQARSNGEFEIDADDLQNCLDQILRDKALFSHLWSKVDKYHRPILTALAFTGDGTEWCDVKQLLVGISHAGSSTRAIEEINDQLNNLVHRRAVLRSATKGTIAYKIAIPLFCEWIRRHWALTGLSDEYVQQPIR